MAKHRRGIGKTIKSHLIQEAGGKCANPGCLNWRTHIHHIKHWAIYEIHDAKHMIAICPSCHDTVHHGSLGISDETLYVWKSISRKRSTDSTVINMERGSDLKILAGTISFSTTSSSFQIFRLPNSSYLSLRILDDEILQVSADIKNASGKSAVRVMENHVQAHQNGLIFDCRAGKAKIAVPNDGAFIPNWVMQQMERVDREFCEKKEIALFDAEVIRPGLMKIMGCWFDNSCGVVITLDTIWILHFGQFAPKGMAGAGEMSDLRYAGDGSWPMFSFGASSIINLNM